MTVDHKAIREALEKATPGKWKGNHAITPYIAVFNGVADEVIASIHSRNNLQLLANAPEWLRQLLDKVELLEHSKANLEHNRKLLSEEKQKLLDENQAQAKEIERLKRQLKAEVVVLSDGTEVDVYEDLLFPLKQLQADKAAAVETLKWYADECNYEVVTYLAGNKGESNSEVSLNKGECARTTLQRIESGEKE